jgi:ABC-type dipeptide/oligopeptide/nickel transport system permease component
MTKFVLLRLLGAIPLVLGIVTIIFFLVNLAPGDPTLLFQSPGMTQEVI